MMKHTSLVCIYWFVTQYKYSLTYGCGTHNVFPESLYGEFRRQCSHVENLFFMF